MRAPATKNAVVVGYDQSPSGEDTLAEAAGAAARRDAPLLILNAYPRPEPSGATLPVPPTSGWAPMDLVDSANTLVGHAVTLARSWHPTLQIEGRVVPGRVWEALAEASREAALLVVGSHSGNAVTDAMLGSVTLRVLADASCPVLVVPGSRHATGRHPLGHPVVAAVDIDEPCDDVLEFAFAEAGRRQAALKVVHVWEEPWNLLYLRHTPGLGNDVALIEERRQLRLTELLRGVGERHPGIEPVAQIRSGSPAKILTEAARSAELIVAGARRRGSGQRHRQWIGPVVHALLHHAECPVAVVPIGSPVVG